jgi:hypothetical protein
MANVLADVEAAYDYLVTVAKIAPDTIIAYCAWSYLIFFLLRI